MTDLIAHIDEQIKSCLGIEEKFYGLCELQESESETFPYVIGSLRKDRVSANDKYQVAIYHRILSGSLADDENMSFGRTMKKRQTLNVRMVVILDVKLGENYIDKIIFALPDKIDISAYHLAEVGSEISKIIDHPGIAGQEFGEAWADKISVHRFNLYAIEYQLQYINCLSCVNS